MTIESAAEVALALAGVLEDASDGSHTIILPIFATSIYKGEVDCELSDPVRINRKHHIEDKLVVQDHTDFKQLFETTLPIIQSWLAQTSSCWGPSPATY